MTKADTNSYSNRRSKRERKRIKPFKKENLEKTRKDERKRKKVQKNKTVSPTTKTEKTFATSAHSAAGIKLPKYPGGKPNGRGSGNRKPSAVGKMRKHKSSGKSNFRKRHGR